MKLPNMEKTLLSSIALSSLLLAQGAVADEDIPPYEFAGEYAFSACTGDVEAYLVMNFASGTLEVETNEGSALLNIDGSTASGRIDIPVSCSSDGQLMMTLGDLEEFSGVVAAACNEMFPPDDNLDLDLNTLLCPSLTSGATAIASYAGDNLPQVITLNQQAEVSELTGANEFFKSWWGGDYEGYIATTNTRADGSTFDLNRPVQDYGRVLTGRTVFNVIALGGLPLGENGLVCGLGTKDAARPTYGDGFVDFHNEFRYIFACTAEVDGQTVILDIEPVVKVDYRMNKVDG